MSGQNKMDGKLWVLEKGSAHFVKTLPFMVGVMGNFGGEKLSAGGLTAAYQLFTHVPASVVQMARAIRVPVFEKYLGSDAAQFLDDLFDQMHHWRDKKASVNDIALDLATFRHRFSKGLMSKYRSSFAVPDTDCTIEFVYNQIGANLTKAKSRVLDYGSGSGILGARLIELYGGQVDRVVGVDLVEPQRTPWPDRMRLLRSSVTHVPSEAITNLWWCTSSQLISPVLPTSVRESELSIAYSHPY